MLFSFLSRKSLLFAHSSKAFWPRSSSASMSEYPRSTHKRSEILFSFLSRKSLLFSHSSKAFRRRSSSASMSEFPRSESDGFCSVSSHSCNHTNVSFAHSSKAFWPRSSSTSVSEYPRSPHKMSLKCWFSSGGGERTDAGVSLKVTGAMSRRGPTVG
jgi:hypothetical protein